MTVWPPESAVGLCSNAKGTIECIQSCALIMTLDEEYDGHIGRSGH